MDNSAENERLSLIEMLRWYQASGVHLAVSETPQNRLDRRQSATAVKMPESVQSNLAPKSSAASPQPPSSPPEAAPDPAATVRLVAACNSMEELRSAYEEFEGCALKKHATQLVFSDGNPEADFMLIGEAPGEQEDRQGKPFVGRAGQLLDRMLASIGLDRDKVFIVNTVPWRPPGNRNPAPLEIAACRPFLDRQVQLTAPKLVMSLGLVATQTLFDEKISITRTRGRWRDVNFGDFTVPVLPTLHPAFLLRQPRQKRQAWQDLLTFQQAIRAL